MLEIREMQQRDLTQVIEIENEVFSVPWSQKGFAASLEMKETLYLAVFQEDQLIGYCGMLMVADEGEITNVAVRKAYRGQHIGYSMLAELLFEGRRRGVERFFLEVRESNQYAIKLYKKLGFSSIGKRRNFYEKPTEDAVIMWKQS